MSFTDVKIKCEWRHVPEAYVEDLGGFEKKSVELSLAVRRRRLTFASSLWHCGGCHTCWGRRWKSQNRKNVYLSPYVEEPLNSKVIKSFVPELRSPKCFSCFGIPMFYVYMLWTFYVHFAYLNDYVTSQGHLS